MNPLLLSITSLLMFSMMAASRDRGVLATSPSGRIAVIQRETHRKSGLFFVDKSSHRIIGAIEPFSGDARSLQNLEIRWRPGESGAAIKVEYGARLSSELLFVRDADGRFIEIRLADVVPESERRKLEHLAGAPISEIGSWISRDRVQFLSGVETIDEEGNSASLLVSYTVALKDGKGHIENVKYYRLKGDLTQQFITKWKSGAR